jgi:hypothetical protein
VTYTVREQFAALGMCLLLATSAAAQSAQPYSLQVSGLASAITYRDTLQPGAGAEVQFRFNRLAASEAGVLSLGIGAQYTRHPFAAGQSFDVSGAFLEPRYAFVLSSERFFPYLAARLGVLRQSSNVVNGSTGYAAGGGGGLGFALGRQVNLDLGLAVLVQRFGATTVVETGRPYTFSTVASYAVRLGLSFGF